MVQIMEEASVDSPVIAKKDIPVITKKRKRKAKVSLKEPKNIKKVALEPKEPLPSKAKTNSLKIEDTGDKYPVLKNQELVNKFLSVSLTNNQKGRIRQLLRDNLKNSSDQLEPEIIHNKIQTILKSSTNLNDTELRKIRILYNMLKTATEEKAKEIQQVADKKAVKRNSENQDQDNPKQLHKNKKDIAKKEKVVEKNETNVEEKETIVVKKEKETNDVKKEKDQPVKKIKGPKRYVVFLGNLPLDVDKNKILQHFTELNEFIKDVRIPKRAEGKKSSIAYLEMTSEPSFELALSKHHTMMENRRINVLYTTQKDGKITKAEAKSKAAKLCAMRLGGRLAGSAPQSKKRTARRNKLKRARAAEQ